MKQKKKNYKFKFYLCLPTLSPNFFLLGLIGLLMCTDGNKLNNRRLHSVRDNFTSDLNNYQSAELMNESARCRGFRKLYDNCWTILHF